MGLRNHLERRPVAPREVSSDQPSPPAHLRKWAALASNLALCGACIWLILAGLFTVTDLSEFAALLVVLTGVQLLLEFSLASMLRSLRRWPHTPRLGFYRFAFAVGFLPLAISVTAVVSRWIDAF
jgi:hypothetical protein